MARADLNVAIDKATSFFWQNGYGGTTMRQLQAALDMRPGSIYAAFGDKDGLYLRAIERYTEVSILKMQTAMASALTAEQGFLDSLSSAVFGSIDTPTNLCFLIKTINELETRQPELVEAAKTSLARVREELARQIEMVLASKGVDVDDIANKSAELALATQSQIIGLKVQLKTTNDRQLIEHSLMAFSRAIVTVERS